MKTLSTMMCIVFALILIPSCDQPKNPTKNPSGIYRTESDRDYEIDFQNGGIGRQKLFGKEGPFQWRVEEDQVIVEAKDESGGGAVYIWDGNDLILRGPNLRFAPKTAP